MKMKNFFLCLFFCFLAFNLISCKGLIKSINDKSAAADSTSSSYFEDSLKVINQQIEEAIYKNDYETLLKFYTEDVTIVPNFQPVLKGKNAVRESYLKQEKAGVKIHSFHTKLDTIWRSRTNIYEYGTYGLSFSTNETKHPYAVTGSYFMIWEKQRSKPFLIKYLISNLDFNPCKDYL